MGRNALRYSQSSIPNHGLGGKDSDLTNTKDMLLDERITELNNTGRKWEATHNGFLIEGKLLIGKHRNRWAIKGKENKWYWFKELDTLLEKVEL
tara:strand:+ start:174 stop:455 length:282 start_codon:yes stop_codon:yes gene_type:complete